MQWLAKAKMATSAYLEVERGFDARLISIRAVNGQEINRFQSSQYSKANFPVDNLNPWVSIFKKLGKGIARVRIMRWYP
jgi:hypothetical protein